MSEGTADIMVRAIEGDYRFAYSASKESQAFHLYKGRCLCRSRESDEIGPRKVEKWKLRDTYTAVPDRLTLCKKCKRRIVEQELRTDIIRDIASILGIENEVDTHFTKEHLRKIRAALRTLEPDQ